ncbi:hypothetical protein B296_00055668 [Ensete ventricosum]|uniref:Transmembrane protein n=1 Tax=Ensete ventricosum TaxID=4639 RepID=A0A426X9N1_ENSVE|nr:hypothetical protein B296_00055668 [Ensete ventricosum]
MDGEGIVVEATTSSSTKLFLPSRTPYVCSLSRADDELRSFRSYLRWMFVDQSDAWHVMISCFLFLLLRVFIPIASHFVLSTASYDVAVQLSLTSTSDLSYLYLFAFVRCYGLRRSLFIDKMDIFLT